MNNNKTIIGISILVIILILIILFWNIGLPQKEQPVQPQEEQPAQEEETPFIPQEETLPESEEFNEVVRELDTPQKLLDYLNQNFSFEETENNQSITPEEFFKAKKGNRNDLATFASFVLYKNGYFATIFRYKFLNQENKEGIRTITLFRDKEGTKYIDFEGSELKIFPGGISSTELCEMEEKRHQITIKEYAAFTYGSTNLENGDWMPR